MPLADDDPTEDITRIFNGATAFVEKALGEGGKVLIHCRSGASRAVCVTTAILVQLFGYGVTDAYFYICHRRREANVFPPYLDQLQAWYSTLEVEPQ
jgi:protein-tyrosine phosphatase